MTNRDTAIQALCRKLGKEYSVTTIDFERVIYRDFGNGFNVEISGMHTTSKRRKAILYLWYGNRAPNCTIVKMVHRGAGIDGRNHSGIRGTYALCAGAPGLSWAGYRRTDDSARQREISALFVFGNHAGGKQKRGVL